MFALPRRLFRLVQEASRYAKRQKWGKFPEWILDRFDPSRFNHLATDGAMAAAFSSEASQDQRVQQLQQWSANKDQEARAAAGRRSK